MPVHHFLTDCHPKNTLKSHHSGGKEDIFSNWNFQKCQQIFFKANLLCFCVKSISEFLSVCFEQNKNMKRWLGYFTIEYGTANSMVNWKIASSIFWEMSYQPLFKLDSIEMCFSISLIRMCYIYSCVKILQILPKQCNSGSWMFILRSLSQIIMTIFPLISIFKPHRCFQVYFYPYF